ncbi:MAG: NYN domain-containing protein [Patescibacteria group bacterium]|jgi:uncharacterized LabA/DUF88 family protein
MTEKEKIAIYIDGGNLYFKLKELKIEHTTDFDYKGLCDYLARGREVVSYRYYVGTIRAGKDDKRGQKLRAGQQRLFNKLLEKNFVIKKGYLMQNNGKFHEKGVDVQIAIDLLIGAYDGMYDAAVLISSDTDLIPAIKKIKYLGKAIEYVGFSHQPSLGMQKNVNLSRLLLEEEVKKFEYKGLV